VMPWLYWVGAPLAYIGYCGGDLHSVFGWILMPHTSDLTGTNTGFLLICTVKSGGPIHTLRSLGKGHHHLVQSEPQDTSYCYSSSLLDNGWSRSSVAFE
jgi:hypothetical protein